MAGNKQLHSYQTNPAFQARRAFNSSLFKRIAFQMRKVLLFHEFKRPIRNMVVRVLLTKHPSFTKEQFLVANQAKMPIGG